MEHYELWHLVLTDAAVVFSALIPFTVAIVLLFNGIKCVLRSEMLRTYYNHVETGTIRQYELENFILLYKAYKALRGNSFIDKIYNEVIKWRVLT